MWIVFVICKSAWNHIRYISQISSCLNRSTIETLVHSFVSSKLDCNNSLLYGVPAYQLNKLQRIQNAAARIITKTSKFDHITPVLLELHWLPIKYRIQYKILLLTFKAINGMAPQYIMDVLSLTDDRLRSHSNCLLDIPSTNLVRSGDRTFASAAPKLWNNLPRKIRLCKSLTSFKGKLKTHLFRLCFRL